MDSGRDATELTERLLLMPLGPVSLTHSTGKGSSCDRRTDRRRVDRTSLE